MSATAMSGFAVRVSPRASLMRNGALSFVFVSVALFGSLYFLAVPLGTWPSVLVIHTVMAATFAFAWVRYRHTFVAVRDGLLHYQGFFRSTWSAPISSIVSVVIVQTYRPNSPETSSQFLARDADGRRVLRMRGLFWYERDMHAIAAALGRELDIRPDPLTTKEFLASYPGSAFWFEGRPLLIASGSALLLAIAFSFLLGLMALTGIAVGLD